MEDCVFCKIINGQLPCVKVWEDDNYLAFLNIYPSVKGSSLVIPKKHLGSEAFELPSVELTKVMEAAQKTSKLLKSKLGATRIAAMIEGMQIDHLHIKLFPIFTESYKGYISTQDGELASMEELTKLGELFK